MSETETITANVEPADVQSTPTSEAVGQAPASTTSGSQASPSTEALPDLPEPAVTLPTTGDEDLDEAIYATRLLTALVVGGVIEGGNQLVTRLKRYEEELQRQKAEVIAAGEVQVVDPEDEYDRLRYAMVGLVFDLQTRVGRSISLAAQLTDSTLETADKVSEPFRNFFLFRPVTKRLEKRYNQLIERGRDSLTYWIDLGREIEPESRMLATLTYQEIVDEFISALADNQEIRALVAQQGISLAAGVRDEVRERTVTVDNIVEDLARRILRRQPREELPAPPPEVQRWAGMSPANLREMQHDELDNESNASQ